jgi:M6 family metalloprotease-like protein
MGEQRTAVILVNFQDKPADKPWTTEQVRSTVFGTVSNFYRENSFQQAWLAGEVFGWYTISQASATCDQLQIASEAKAAASAAGVNLSTYARYVYVFPKNSTCSWSGQASVGGTPSQAWINGELTLDVLGHEIGHNLGLHHSHASICNGTTLGANCTLSEYGDSVDVMGGAKSAHFNAFQKEFLGWLGGVATPPILTVSASGTYQIDPYASSGGTNPKALKILKSTDPLTGKRTFYYIEYRQPIGFDAPLGDTTSMLLTAANVMNGVLLHTGSADESGNTSFLLDMTPETYDSFYPRDPALVAGRMYTDSAAGVTINSAWANGTTAGITVALSQVACVRANPVVAILPATQQGSPGAALTYTVTVTNKDPASCGVSSFNMTGTVPLGWAGTFAIGSLTAAAGASASTTWTVASPTSVAAGSYPISVSAANGASSSSSGTASAAYSVVGASGPSVSLVTDKSVYASGQAVNLTTTVKSGGAPVVKANVTFAITNPNGLISNLSSTTDANGVASTRYRTARKDLLGTYQAKATFAGSAGSASGSASFTIQ